MSTRQVVAMAGLLLFMAAVAAILCFLHSPPCISAVSIACTAHDVLNNHACSAWS